MTDQRPAGTQHGPWLTRDQQVPSMDHDWPETSLCPAWFMTDQRPAVVQHESWLIRERESLFLRSYNFKGRAGMGLKSWLVWCRKGEENRPRKLSHPSYMEGKEHHHSHGRTSDGEIPEAWARSLKVYIRLLFGRKGNCWYALGLGIPLREMVILTFTRVDFSEPWQLTQT